MRPIATIRNTQDAIEAGHIARAQAFATLFRRFTRSPIKRR